MSLPGSATFEGTARYAQRFQEKIPASHFRNIQGLSVSSLGIGTYLGESTDAVDQLYRDAIVKAVESGCNFIDTAVNYRCQRSERVIGEALRILIKEKGFSREEILVATKGGYLPFDGAYPADPKEYFENTFIKTGLLKKEEIVGGCHSLSVPYLKDQFERSLKNLELGTIDIYYLHNPETQLEEFSRKDFLEKIKNAFAFLEERVKEGKLRFYGTATWNGFRLEPKQKAYLSLQELELAARQVGGAEHHFRAVQFPYNLSMTEAFTNTNQQVGPGSVSMLDACKRYGMFAVASASLLQGRLSGQFPEKLKQLFPGAETSAQCALQFVRSTPGLTAALTGMKNVKHVEENLAVAQVQPLKPSDFMKLFNPVAG